MKGASEIATAVVLVGVTIVSTGVVLDASGPVIEDMRDTAAIESSVSFLNSADDSIRSVASEGEGSTRTVNLDFDRGSLHTDSSDNSLTYSLETGSDIISPQSSTERGAVTMASNAVTSVEESEVDGEPCFLMENDRVEVCIQKVGGEEDLENIDTSELIHYYRLKGDEGGEVDMDFKVELNEDPDSMHGEGYTFAEEEGGNMARGDVYAEIDASNGMSYTVVFQLYSGADFLSVRVME